MFNNQRGSTLIEVLVAILLMAIVLTGLSTALSYTLKNSAQADYRQLATRHAQDVIEILRKERDSLGSWATFRSTLPSTGQVRCVPGTADQISEFTASTTCMTTNNVTVAESPVGFRRRVTIDQNTATLVQVTVTVEWVEGSATRDVDLVQQFRDIN